MGEEGSFIRTQERDNLRLIIQQWNANRLDLFEISEPNESLEFHGVMRFYFQDPGQKVATKCIRVSSTATTRQVIETLIEKFRPDMRMLSIPEYSLYEIHEMEDERRLNEEEKPLLVQLNWNKDDREGRFLLRRLDINGMAKIKTLPPMSSTPQPPINDGNFIRKLSRREKKELKKQEKMRRAVEGAETDHSVAEKLYTELPETSFTRSISNPEAVMRRRRAQKLEKKLQQFRSKDGGPDTGGTLKIYGESLCKDVPYKTLLLSVRDNAYHVVREMLDKYGLYREDPANYCLVQCIVTAEETLDGYQGQIIPQKEYVLDDEECPLSILMNHPPSRGSIMFQVRRRPADHGQRKRKKKPLKGSGIIGAHQQHPPSRHQHAELLLPFLVEIGPDGTDLLGSKGRQHQLQLNVTEVGTDRSAHSGGQSLQLFGPHIQPRHCVIAHTDGIVTVTPCSRDAEIFVNYQRIYETTILQHGSVVRFGRTHTFRFIDPQHDDRMRLHLTPQQQLQHSHHHQPYQDRGNYARFGPSRDPILPAVLEFKEEAEDAFLHNIITQLDPTDIQFKLAPTYTLYMAARFRASTHYRPDLSPTERAEKLTDMLTKVASYLHKVIEFKHQNDTALAFWMANASELLHFLKQDRHICGYSLDAQDILAEAVQFAFRQLVEFMQRELANAMPLFLEDRNDHEEEEGCSAHILSILMNAMVLLRRCRVNAALTIQLFSQLFHYVNMWVFNKVLSDPSRNYCTREWGERIKERLGRIELWAEKQGLELAADCHLGKLSQAALLLTAIKNSPDNVSNLSSTCYKLNSLQLRQILEQYEPDVGEPSIPNELIDNVVSVAETTADGLAREDGREVRLEEEADLQLPFLLPEDGYSCDILRGVPSGLEEFLKPLQMAQLCRMTPQPTSTGFWTIYMHNQQDAVGHRPPTGPRSPSAMSNRSMSIPRGDPEVRTIQLHKSNSGMGLSIVATKGENQDQLGIYIKSVVPGGAADQDGRLQAGDQLLSVDGKSLVGISQEEAAQYMVGTGPIVTLEVARQGALYHGLAPLLSQPSPQVNRDLREAMPPDLNLQRQQSLGHLQQQQSQSQKSLQNHPHQQHFGQQSSLHKQPMYSPNQQGPPSHMHPRIQSAKSVPSLTSDPAAKQGHHDMFNPSYSRTSSSTSLSQPQHNQGYPFRSRSTQNLNEGMTLSLTGRHPSNPTLASEDDRHYQNISFHQGTQDPRMGSQRGGRPPILPPTQSLDRNDNRPTSAFMQREDSRTDALQRPSSQMNVRDLQLAEDPRRRDERLRFNGHSFPTMPQQSPGAAPISPGVRGMPPTSRGYGYPGSTNQSVHQHFPQSVQPPHSSPAQGYPSPQQISPQYANSPQSAKTHAPPPTAPKPNRGSGSYFTEPEKPLRLAPNDGTSSIKHSIAAVRSAAEEGYRDSPPPPPPPTSTHPLLQTGPPSGGSRTPSGNATMKPEGVKGPWKNDEKEQYEIRKKEAIRRWRDEQISSLECLDLRSPQEEERLNRLKLEREFQRRAEEAQRDEEEEHDEEGSEEEDDFPTSNQNAPFSSAKSPTSNQNASFSSVKSPTVNQNAPFNNIKSPLANQNIPHNIWNQGDIRPNGGGPVIEDRAKKVDEIRRKQQELEAAKEAEERLLREAQRRQEEEEIRRQSHFQRHQHQASQRLDTLVGAPPPGSQQNYTNGPSNGMRIGSTSPLPPERGSSYSVMQSSSSGGGGSSRGRNNDTPVKKVQFSSASPMEPKIIYDDNANQEKITSREDPNNFINEAENILNSNSQSRSPGTTPGVIGAQEVYRDPRQRRLMEQAQKAAASRSLGPEKLTFREKMKMFAMETGEAETPKDKMKTSKAQREIEYPVPS